MTEFIIITFSITAVFLFWVSPSGFQWKDDRNKKGLAQMKTFTRENDNDLFPKGLFHKETRRAIRAVAILFAIMIRRDNEIMASEALVAHEYFDKRFKASHYMKMFSEDKKVLRSLLKKYLKGKLPTFTKSGLASLGPSPF